MFPGKFFLAEPIFSGLREISTTNELQRFTKFGHAVHVLLRWFETMQELDSVKVSAIALVDSQKIPFSVRIQHHFQLVTIGLPQVMTANEFASEYLPVNELGNGMFELSRQDPDVLEYFRLVQRPESGTDLELEYRTLVLKLGMRMDGAFEPCSVNHDLGLATFS